MSHPGPPLARSPLPSAHNLPVSEDFSQLYLYLLQLGQRVASYHADVMVLIDAVLGDTSRARSAQPGREPAPSFGAPPRHAGHVPGVADRWEAR